MIILSSAQVRISILLLLLGMASGTPKPDGSQAQNPTVPNGSEPTMVPK